MQPQVVIVGAGPVGLTLAIDLGKRNIRTLVVEEKPEPAFLPKMERCNARTMEIFRRLGIVEDVRKAGPREDIPMDVFVVLSLTQPPLLRLPYPSVKEARLDARATNDGTAPCEPYQLISQYTLEPVLAKIAASLPTVELAWSIEFLGMKQDADGVDVDLRKSDGSTHSLRCDYMVGCDGGVSPVRHALNIKLRGEANLLGLRQALFKCDDLFATITWPTTRRRSSSCRIRPSTGHCTQPSTPTRR